jgi:hypothetical protein
LSASRLVADLRARGITLFPEGGTVRCRAPKGALTPELRELLRQRKAEVLEALQRESAVSSRYHRLAFSEIVDRYAAATDWIVEHLAANWEGVKASDGRLSRLESAADAYDAELSRLRELLEAGVAAFEAAVTARSENADA